MGACSSSSSLVSPTNRSSMHSCISSIAASPHTQQISSTLPTTTTPTTTAATARTRRSVEVSKEFEGECVGSWEWHDGDEKNETCAKRVIAVDDDDDDAVSDAAQSIINTLLIQLLRVPAVQAAIIIQYYINPTQILFTPICLNPIKLVALSAQLSSSTLSSPSSSSSSLSFSPSSSPSSISSSSASLVSQSSSCSPSPVLIVSCSSNPMTLCRVSCESSGERAAGRYPQQMAVDEEHVYVSEMVGTTLSLTGMVSVWTKKAPPTFISSFGRFIGPDGIAVDNIYVYVCDYWTHGVHVFNKSTLTFVRFLGANDVLHFPKCVTIDENNIYVSDVGLHLVQIFDKHTFELKVSVGAGKGSENGQLDNPAGVAVTSHSLVVADTGNHRVQLFDKNTGTFVHSFGSRGKEAGQFHFPPSVCYLRKLNLLAVADTYNGRIQFFK